MITISKWLLYGIVAVSVATGALSIFLGMKAGLREAAADESYFTNKRHEAIR